MTIQVLRDVTEPLRHIIHVDKFLIPADISTAEGGSDSGPSPHDLYDSALASCTALTVQWYANRKQLPLQDVRVAIERDASEERSGVYRLKVVLHFSGDLSDAQRKELLSAADKCPVHKLMSRATTEITTELG